MECCLLYPWSLQTTLNGNCSYFSDTSSYSLGEKYMCACRGKADELSWKQSDLCAKVPLGAATKPSICRIKKASAACWVGLTVGSTAFPVAQTGCAECTC